ncbi:helix-turn-helix transcriptional regulator [Labrenzia sp. PHM005]|uniref:helix-turn-helix transcriptional regulator n=1 Tax=Labrenzia sp. PHM005 TaxID=2590016 RepID=UPI0011402531|nr:helix-turn-helix transcriptional regulator [Labrenzia sp. PHM005]QDG77695.1 helix-turn-helix transcriptional regulator [Labrenzia sp. PHM005]
MNLDFLRFGIFDEIEAFWLENMGVEPALLQLSAGSLNFEVCSHDLAGLTVTWVRSEGRQLWHDTANEGAVHFGYVIDSQGPVVSGGIEVGSCDAMVWMPSKEINYLLEGPLTSVEFTIPDELAAMLGWKLKGPPLQKVFKADLDNLTHSALMASEWLNANSDCVPEVLAIRKQIWRDWILEALSKVLVPWLNSRSSGILPNPSTRKFRMIKSAVAMFDAADPDLDLDVDEIAANLGVSRRTLFYSFQKELGIGPRRYFELRRLHALRRDLAKSHRDEQTVTNLAHLHGFTQLGRMASVYKEHFGETPSETLGKSN